MKTTNITPTKFNRYYWVRFQAGVASKPQYEIVWLTRALLTDEPVVRRLGKSGDLYINHLNGDEIRFGPAVPRPK